MGVSILELIKKKQGKMMLEALGGALYSSINKTEDKKGRFIFNIDESEHKTFQGIIIGMNIFRICYDRPGASGKKWRCISQDGIQGTWKDDNLEQIIEIRNCADCPYNKYDVEKKKMPCPKHFMLTVKVPDYKLPMTLKISYTGREAYREYIKSLLTKNLPAAAVITEFSLQHIQDGGYSWNIIKYKMVKEIKSEDKLKVVLELIEEHERVIERTKELGSLITPQLEEKSSEPEMKKLSKPKVKKPEPKPEPEPKLEPEPKPEPKPEPEPEIDLEPDVKSEEGEEDEWEI